MKTTKLPSPVNPQPPSGFAAIQPTGTVAGDTGDRTASLLRKVRTLLDAGLTAQAFNYLKPATSDPVVKNARGVCLLRMGQPASALIVYRELCLTPGGISLRAEAPTVWKTNFATTLMIQDNLSGAKSVLDEIDDAQHGEVRKLRAAISRWEAGLTFWQRLQWRLGHQPNRPIVLDFAPGALE